MKQQVKESMKFWTWLLILPMILLAGCSGGSEGDEVVAPTDEAQIKSMVEDFFKRDPELPEYVANVEAIEGTWARVSISPEGVENIGDPVVLYVQDQINDPDPVPTAAIELSQPRNDAEVETKLGWAIITQPQAHFTDEELDAAQVPESIRQ